MIRIEHVTKKFKTKEGEVCALSDKQLFYTAKGI